MKRELKNCGQPLKLILGERQRNELQSGQNAVNTTDLLLRFLLFLEYLQLLLLLVLLLFTGNRNS